MRHTITHFDHVKVPASALLGSLTSDMNARERFQLCVRRVRIGCVLVAAIHIPALRVAAYIATQYSRRRTVKYSQDLSMPILSFRTQQLPIAYALARASVLEALYTVVTPNYTHDDSDHLPAILKALAVKLWRTTATAITDRLGAQGLFEFNQIMRIDVSVAGVRILTRN